MTEVPAEQDLSLNHFEIKTIKRGVADPPEVLLIADVTHEETMIEWRTQIRMSRRQAVELIALLRYVAKSEGLEWPS